MALSVWQVEGIRAAYKSCCLTPVRNPVVYAKHLRNFKHFFIKYVNNFVIIIRKF